MPEESKESKARKLAAARKKLKEYQQRGNVAGSSSTNSNTYADSSTNSGHDSSNISERSESDLQLNGSCNEINQQEHILEPETAAAREETVPTENVNYFTMDQPLEESSVTNSSVFSMSMGPTEESHIDSSHNINAIQVLITEKAQLTSELNKCRTLCREKDLELEELRVQHNNSTKRVDDLTQRLVDMQKQQEQQRLHNAELQHKLAQARAQSEDQSTHINEIQQQLTLRDDRLKQLESEFKNKSNELELTQLRIRQLSDENNITNDNRVETLTQTQFMYEQQIRDLQAMVQQLTQDKEQANTQYQTYVQQLNAQVQQLNERNNEVMEESSKLQEREKQWVDHIQQLEREIQKNISKQTEIREDQQKEILNETQNQQLESLQERINEFDNERYEFQLKIKSQEDRLNIVQGELKQKEYEIEQLKDLLDNITSEQPDKTKLLATMESDKVAASRALSQNVELKKQLDELEQRFVQLTNDKADLMTRLDSEQYANREMQTNYAAMQERLNTNDERFKFKDEEMIRLSHENEELKKELQQKVYGHHEECEYDESKYDHQHNQEHDHEHEHHHHDDSNGHTHHGHNHHENDPDCNDHTAEVCQSATDHESCHEATEENIIESTENKTPTRHKATSKESYAYSTSPHIATEEAVEKLQQRFTQLMTQCADLTDEKQRLEHLVMQLQSETETIGEYIALYQTQRRILKQREYEKAAQTAMLQEEREQMRERLTMLNNLVNTLGMEIPQNQQLKQQLSEALAQSVAIDGTTAVEGDSVRDVKHNDSSETSSSNVACSPVLTQFPTKNLNSTESQQILHKIQDIITEIKENTKELPTLQHTVDHLNCCSGKFEVV